MRIEHADLCRVVGRGDVSAGLERLILLAAGMLAPAARDAVIADCAALQSGARVGAGAPDVQGLLDT